MSWSETHKIAAQTINKSIEVLKNTINQQDLIDIYRTIHPTTAAFLICPCAIHQDKPYPGL